MSPLLHLRVAQMMGGNTPPIASSVRADTIFRKDSGHATAEETEGKGSGAPQCADQEQEASSRGQTESRQAKREEA
jgi:hypothetical protein